MVNVYMHQKDVEVAGVCSVMTKNATELSGPCANIFWVRELRKKFCNQELKVDVRSGFDAV